MAIGVFDSGIGGITVLKEALEVIPDEDYIYYADTKHVPYGIKSKEEVRGFIFDAVEFLARKGINTLVIACNTATSIAVNDLRKKYSFPIIGMEPAVKPAVQMNGNGRRVLVLATPLTLKETKFRDLVARVDEHGIVDYLPVPELVEMTERLVSDRDIVVPFLKEKLSVFDLSLYGTLVLGCTHFLFYRHFFEEALPGHISIIDGNRGTVAHLNNVMMQRGLRSGSGSGNIDFYISGERAYGTDLERFKFLLDIA